MKKNTLLLEIKGVAFEESIINNWSKLCIERSEDKGDKVKL